MGKRINSPSPFIKEYDVESFSCGNSQLDEWLKKRALKNEKNHASRTFVICDENKVIGYYALAAGSVFCAEVVGRISRSMPDPIPVMVLGRLGVDTKFQNKGLGRGLLKDAILRTLEVSKIAGIRALLVHALDAKAASFYEKTGFLRSSLNNVTLAITLNDALEQI